MLRSLALAALVGTGAVLAAGTKCDLDNKCPESAPCCSQFGECGVGAYCLGGCDPRMSYSFEACVPAPVCQDSETKFDSMDSIVDIGDYLGDPKDGTWVGNGEPRQYKDSVLLTMPKDSGGSILSSSTYMWYGNVKARMKTSRGKGVITAFILFSDIKDEIDYEFVGADLETAQTNYYFQGVLDWHNSKNISLSDTFHNFHDYEIRWTPDKIDWLVDGQVGRTVERKDTWNKTSNQWMFPQTPSRVQLSLWPGGLESNAQGTIDWAGGVIDWDSQDIQDAGYYYVTIESVSIECYNADSPPGTNKGTSYYYNEGAGTNDTVVDGDKDTVLASLQGTGLDMDKGKKDSTKTKDKDEPSSTAATIPNGNGSGDDHSGDSDDSSSSDDSGSDSGSGSGSDSSSGSGSSSGTADTSNCDPSSFSMDCSDDDSSADGSSGSGSGSGDGNTGSRAGASVLAIIVAGFALFWL